MKKKILVVDDEPMICEILRDYLELDFFEVSEAYNGKQAFEMIKQENFDCVVSDVRMPNGDGRSLAQKIAQMPDPKPIVFLTTGYSEISEEEVKNLGVVKVLHKPFQSKEFIDCIKKAL
ncbi:MAG: response regulator [Bdellovibrionaceae bacterium]|nr:response regulator [Bdellovibrio sp.]